VLDMGIDFSKNGAEEVLQQVVRVLVPLEQRHAEMDEEAAAKT